MKKLFLMLILIVSPQVYAYEDYLIISDRPVKSVSVTNHEIADAHAIFTIYNNKTNIILKVKNSGKTKLNLSYEDETLSIDIKTTPIKTSLSSNNNLEYFSLDIPNPDDYVEILPPHGGI